MCACAHVHVCVYSKYATIVQNILNLFLSDHILSSILNNGAMSFSF